MQLKSEGRAAQINSHSSPTVREGSTVSSAETTLVPTGLLAGTMPEGPSIFRNGNAMSENYEVSEVFGISRRRNSCHCPPRTLEQSGLKFLFLSQHTQAPGQTQTRDGVRFQEQ